MEHSWGTVEAQLGLIMKNSRGQLGHKVTWGIVGAQLRHSRGKSSRGTVEALLRHSWGTITGQTREKLVWAQFRHIWGTHFSCGRVKMKVSLEVRN